MSNIVTINLKKLDADDLTVRLTEFIHNRFAPFTVERIGNEGWSITHPEGRSIDLWRKPRTRNSLEMGHRSGHIAAWMQCAIIYWLYHEIGANSVHDEGIGRYVPEFDGGETVIHYLHMLWDRPVVDTEKAVLDEYVALRRHTPESLQSLIADFGPGYRIVAGKTGYKLVREEHASEVAETP